MAKTSKPKETPKKEDNPPAQVSHVELISIHAELVKAIPGGSTVEDRQAIADRLDAYIKSL